MRAIHRHEHLTVFGLAALVRLLHRHNVSLVMHTDQPGYYHLAKTIESKPLLLWMQPEPVRELIGNFQAEIRAMARLYATRPPSNEWTDMLAQLGVRMQVRFREKTLCGLRLRLPGYYAIRLEVWSTPSFPKRRKAEFCQQGAPAASRAPEDGPPQRREHLALVARVEEAEQQLAGLLDWGSRWGVRPDATLDPLTVTLADCRAATESLTAVNSLPASTLNRSQQTGTQAMTAFQPPNTVNLPQGGTHD
ncbi:MAG: hypothetical protein AMXMBFR33_56180 [Candidatus Xenobia bacterium]